MADAAPGLKKITLDKKLDKIGHVEAAVTTVARGLAGPSLGLLFLIFAAVFKALMLGGALIIAAVFESAGALIAGGDVVSTISRSIIEPTAVASPETFIRVMTATLMSSALWVNLATWIGAPVSTTHSVVGGAMGAGRAAAGMTAVNWTTMGAIATSWVISPLLGGVIAAVFLAFIKNFIIYMDDKIAAARRWMPVLITIMAGAFAGYLAMKGLKKVIKLNGPTILLIGAVVGIASYLGHHTPAYQEAVPGS